MYIVFTFGLIATAKEGKRLVEYRLKCLGLGKNEIMLDTMSSILTQNGEYGGKTVDMSSATYIYEPLISNNLVWICFISRGKLLHNLFKLLC